MRIRWVSVELVEVERARWRRRMVVRESGKGGLWGAEWAVSERGFSISFVGVVVGGGDGKGWTAVPG